MVTTEGLLLSLLLGPLAFAWNFIKLAFGASTTAGWIAHTVMGAIGTGGWVGVAQFIPSSLS